MDDPPPEDACPPGVNPWAGRPHVVIVKMRDGRESRRASSIVRVLDPDALDWDGVLAKFHACAEFSGICRPASADAIVAAVIDLRDAFDCSALCSACILTPGSAA
jgi:hypothetical protein